MMFLKEEHKLIRETVRAFAREHIAPFAHEWDKTHTYPADVVRAMGKMGLLGMTIPEEWGGSNAGSIALAIAVEEIAAADASCSTIMSVNNSIACMPIYQYGNREQKEQFLQPLARGEKIGCFCLTEPGAGSDAGALQTKAVLDGDFYVLNGVKQFISSGKNADIAVAFAVTSPQKGRKGISAFIVPTTTPGYIVSRVEEKLGQMASDTAQLTFRDMRIPLGYRLGEEGEGYKIALSNLEGGRIGIAAQSVGIARAAFVAALSYAQERKAFDKFLFEHQAIAFKLADMSTAIDAARLLTLQAAYLKEHNEPCLKEASEAKLFASEMAEKVCSDAIQIYGGYGYIRDFPVERYYRDVRVTQIYEGTSEVQRLVIAREIQKNRSP